MAVAAAWFWYLIWQLVSKTLTGVVYFAITAEGARILVPFMGTKLSKLPGLKPLSYYEETYRLDVAHLFALALLMATFWLWFRQLQLWLGVGEAEDDGYDPLGYALILGTLTAVVIGADLYMFYRSVAMSGWGGGGFSLTSLIATVAWGGVLVFVAFVSVTLHKPIDDAKRKD